jgi:hypothetical protein
MSNRYGVMIPFDGEMLFVTRGAVQIPVGARRFDTEVKAEELAAIWGDGCCGC